MSRPQDRDVAAARQVDLATRTLVPTCEPGSLPSDPKYLKTMFTFCTNNWRTYPGEKPSGRKLARINAVFKQATLGDCFDHVPEGSTTFERTVTTLWRGYRGTPSLVAKRRFLALIREVDEGLLEVKAYHYIPWGFPTTPSGERICPYCNSRKGCPRPLMDKYGHNLQHELDGMKSNLDFVQLKKWIDEVAPQQRCSLGVHTAITNHMGSRFAKFFARPECDGFQPYPSTDLQKLIKKVLVEQLSTLVEMQSNPRAFSRDAQVSQRDRVSGLQQYYTSMAGHGVMNEAPCSRDSHQCNTRRLADGANHTHPVVFRMPPTDFSLYDPITQVRQGCTRLGVSPITGPVSSIDERHRLLQLKIADFHREKMLVYESRRRQQSRAGVALKDAAVLRDFARHHTHECIQQALIAKDMDLICSLVEAGADPTSETRGGFFPLMLAVLKRSLPAIQRLLAAGADADRSNSRGMTALMWAVKRDDYAMVDALIGQGADVSVEGCTGWTALSIAARHGKDDIARLLVDSLRRDESTGKVKSDRALNHRSTLRGGLTPIAIAAIHRNESMVRFLMRWGANPGVKCYRGDDAGKHATRAGWWTLGLWLKETKAFGTDGIYTYDDIQAEKALRIAAIRMLDAIKSGATAPTTQHEQERRKVDANSDCIESRGNPRRSSIPCDNSINIKPWRLLGDATSIKVEQLRANTLLTVKLLQEGLVAPDTETEGGHTALISASYRGLANGVQMLIREGADPNYRNRNDRTALMAAVAAGHHSVAILLLMEGADPGILDINGKSAGAFAFDRGHYKLAELLARVDSLGCERALEWEHNTAESAEEEGSQYEMTPSLGRGDEEGGVTSPNIDLPDWTVSTATQKDAKPSTSKESVASATEQLVRHGPIDARDNTRFSQSAQACDEQRCPMCTLLVPCLHFHSVESLTAEFPDGVPEWRWNEAKTWRSSRRHKQNAKLFRENTERPSTLHRNALWWKHLHQLHRCRTSQTTSRTTSESSSAA